jgi:hypothetical protein
MPTWPRSTRTLCAALLLCACNAAPAAAPGDGGSPADGLAADLASPYPAAFPPVPRVVNDNGGAVLTAPLFVPVFFHNFDATTRVKLLDFLGKVGATDYWKQTTSEYGVGPASVADPVDLSESASGTIASGVIDAWLAAKLNHDDPAFPAPTDQTIYVLHYPSGVSVTMSNNGTTSTSCDAFGAYHGDLRLDAGHGYQNVAYAVMPTCARFGSRTGLDAFTASESHELIEAATDPYPRYDPGFSSPDSDHEYWAFLLGGGEAGDLCAQDPLAFTRFTELPYTVQRSWSNKAALAGHDPCVPALAGEVYFNAAPVLADTITLAGQITLPGVQLAVGQQKSIPIQLWSDGPTSGPWTVMVRDASTLLGMPASLSLRLDRTSGKNGDVLNLTVKVQSASQLGAGLFMVQSKLGTVTHTSFGIVAP